MACRSIRTSIALFPAFVLSFACFAGAAVPGGRVDAGAGYSLARGGWTFVHLEGSPKEMGRQHGQLLAAQIEDTLNVIRLENTHDTQRDWKFFREAAQRMLWPLAWERSGMKERPAVPMLPRVSPQAMAPTKRPMT